eukprot:15275464-Alexandrium_andersonii.AAC.1
MLRPEPCERAANNSDATNSLDRANIGRNEHPDTVNLGHEDWDLHSELCPECNPQSARCSFVLPSASIRNPPCGACNIASCVRTWNCVAPRSASTSISEAPNGCALRRVSWRFRNRRRAG